MIAVLCPFVDLHPTVRQVLEAYASSSTAISLRFVHLTDDDMYRRVLQGYWQQRAPFTIVESDVIPWPGAISELHECVGEWCTYSYQPYGVQHAFGCAKFTSALMNRLPTIWDEPRHWSQLDTKLYLAAQAIGQLPHPHRPPVTHLKVS